jgi:hypothetical protein
MSFFKRMWDFSDHVLHFIFRKDIFAIIAFLIAFIFIIAVLRVDLVFSNTVVTGGDTGSHVYIPYI